MEQELSKSNVQLDIAPPFLESAARLGVLLEALFIAVEKNVPAFLEGGVPALTIRMTDDEEIQDLNSRYRGKEKPTNVLSFTNEDPYAHLGGEERYLGDIVISIPTVEREAEEQNKKFENHLSHMALHGVLHLLGYNHEVEIEAKEMEDLEVRVLTALGIPNPYELRD